MPGSSGEELESVNEKWQNYRKNKEENLEDITRLQDSKANQEENLSSLKGRNSARLNKRTAERKVSVA